MHASERLFEDLQTAKTFQNHWFTIDFQAKSIVFYWFPCQNLLSAADMLTAGATEKCPEMQVSPAGDIKKKYEEHEKYFLTLEISKKCFFTDQNELIQ